MKRGVFLLPLALLMGCPSGPDPVDAAAEDARRKARETGREVDEAARKTRENLDKAKAAADAKGKAIAGQGREDAASPPPTPPQD